MLFRRRESKQEQPKKRSFWDKAGSTIKAVRVIWWLLGIIVAVVIFGAIAFCIKQIGVEFADLFNI